MNISNLENIKNEKIKGVQEAIKTKENNSTQILNVFKSELNDLLEILNKEYSNLLNFIKNISDDELQEDLEHLIEYHYDDEYLNLNYKIVIPLLYSDNSEDTDFETFKIWYKRWQENPDDPDIVFNSFDDFMKACSSGFTNNWAMEYYYILGLGDIDTQINYNNKILYSNNLDYHTAEYLYKSESDDINLTDQIEAIYNEFIENLKVERDRTKSNVKNGDYSYKVDEFINNCNSEFEDRLKEFGYSIKNIDSKYFTEQHSIDIDTIITVKNPVYKDN